ncbi:hypothetical protein [Jeongeupia naejangsanensis]|uniref:Secreted protein n=1 Tax=Jeongeupia naejangsanensis TaxID=613195 RepID=A0ABS2BJ97_9NEIS|nr:hypothetical protein [Jeongeupia naejangsanensis]MBM3115071.1 hypothetical protein [Jeongeupia naejangsanensis]
MKRIHCSVFVAQLVAGFALACPPSARPPSAPLPAGIDGQLPLVQPVIATPATVGDDQCASGGAYSDTAQLASLSDGEYQRRFGVPLAASAPPFHAGITQTGGGYDFFISTPLGSGGGQAPASWEVRVDGQVIASGSWFELIGACPASDETCSSQSAWIATTSLSPSAFDATRYVTVWVCGTGDACRPTPLLSPRFKQGIS